MCEPEDVGHLSVDGRIGNKAAEEGVNLVEYFDAAQALRA